jgi:predicted transcriptional regulator
MANDPLKTRQDVQPVSELEAKAADLLRDVHRGLADAEAGRVVPHEEARARLLSRYST